MGSRLLPLALTIGALVADGLGLHRFASYLVLLAIVGAAGAAIASIGGRLAGHGSLLQAVTSGIALALLVAGSAVRQQAPIGHVPTFALSTLVLATVVYVLPLLSWVLEPVVVRAQQRNPLARIALRENP